MDLDNLYNEKEVTPTNKESLMKFISGLQLFGNIVELYTVKVVATGTKLIETVFKK